MTCDLDPEIRSYPGVMKDYPRTKFGVDMNSSFPIMTQTDERKTLPSTAQDGPAGNADTIFTIINFFLFFTTLWYG